MFPPLSNLGQRRVLRLGRVMISRSGFVFGLLLVCSTLALYEEPPGGCAGPPDDDLLQPPKATRRPPRPPPPEAPPAAEPDDDDSQAALQRQVCVPRGHSPPIDPHLSRIRASRQCSRSPSPSRPSPMAPAPAPALAPALADASYAKHSCS